MANAGSSSSSRHDRSSDGGRDVSAGGRPTAAATATVSNKTAADNTV